ncbi:molybdenum cofactor sulfurase [Nannochloropsis oceanica]
MKSRRRDDGERRPRATTCLVSLPLLLLLLHLPAPTAAVDGGISPPFTTLDAATLWDLSQLDFTAARQEFLALQPDPDVYGYDGLLDKIRDEDTPHMKNQVYLDWTGSAVYRASMVDAVAEDLKKNLYGNTHSINPSSMLTEKKVDEVRERIVDFFNTTLSEYSVIFTSGATAALHLLSETFPWSNRSRFTYLEQSHNSVLGIRELCLHNGGDFCALREWEVNGERPESSQCNSCGRTELNAPSYIAAAATAAAAAAAASSSGEGDKASYPREPYHLFAFPAQDNFAGIKYNLSWIDYIQKADNVCGKRGDWRVLLDAAAFVPSSRLDLGKFSPDFVTLSFYKLFGIPTGLGCLLVHKRSIDILRKVYWGGGSVVVAMTQQPITVFKGNPCAKYEDGTLNFLSIINLNAGFDSFDELGIDRITRHVWALTQWTYEQLMLLKHSNGHPVVRVYGKHGQGDSSVQGGVISFNVLRPDGRYVGYHQVQKLAAKNRFHVRSGCQCNPGACFDYLGLSYEQVSTFFLNKESCGDEKDVVNGGTLPLGAIRISFGSLTTFEDVQAWIEFLKTFYVDSGEMAAWGVEVGMQENGFNGGGHWAIFGDQTGARVA